MLTYNILTSLSIDILKINHLICKKGTNTMTATCTTYYHHTDLNATSGALTHRYYVRDYLGSVRAVIDEEGNVLQSTAYYPSGVPLTPNSLTPQTIKLHTGKDFFDLQGAGWYDNQARYYDCLIPTFKSIDPLAEKYPWLSPYNHCANNPLKFVDRDGKEIYIERRYGFLGLRKETLRYDNGILYTSSGEQFSKKDKFINNTLTAISVISETETGADLISTLSSSDNSFIIKKGTNGFKADNYAKAQCLTQNPNASEYIKVGCGGIIYWNPNITESVPDEKGQTSRPAYIGLAHELGHGYVANNGTANYTRFMPNHFDIEFQGIRYDEFNAIKIENSIRKELGLPLRKSYSIDSNGELFMPID